jgi:hypothetical protein
MTGGKGNIPDAIYSKAGLNPILLDGFNLVKKILPTIITPIRE